MNNITTLLHVILFGDFGLLTLTPRYLFLVLFPIMVFLGVFGQILPKIPFLQVFLRLHRSGLHHCGPGIFRLREKSSHEDAYDLAVNPSHSLFLPVGHHRNLCRHGYPARLSSLSVFLFCFYGRHLFSHFPDISVK